MEQIKHDPRNKLAITHMVLYSLAHNRVIDEFSMKNALKEIDDFTDFFIHNDIHPVAYEIIDLLKSGRRIIEIHQAGDSSIKEVIEVALCDLNKAVEMIGNILKRKLPADPDW